ncbi:hypothetical protein SAY87_008561 [Trapa incisa]|uniref:Uncharacterized protein n=1 Tax=Trapa incisa TaxID=236973 RepID=A0AAN7PW21_9MYRT|nr:hypothetical protein SAY87_008561 [Trapa incisa]
MELEDDAPMQCSRLLRPVLASPHFCSSPRSGMAWSYAICHSLSPSLSSLLRSEILFDPPLLLTNEAYSSERRRPKFPNFTHLRIDYDISNTLPSHFSIRFEIV